MPWLKIVKQLQFKIHLPLGTKNKSGAFSFFFVVERTNEETFYKGKVTRFSIVTVNIKFHCNYWFIKLNSNKQNFLKNLLCFKNTMNCIFHKFWNCLRTDNFGSAWNAFTIKQSLKLKELIYFVVTLFTVFGFR